MINMSNQEAILTGKWKASWKAGANGRSINKQIKKLWLKRVTDCVFADFIELDQNHREACLLWWYFESKILSHIILISTVYIMLLS